MSLTDGKLTAPARGCACANSQLAAGMPVKEFFWKHGLSEPSYHTRMANIGGMKVSGARRLKALETDAMREVLKESGAWRRVAWHSPRPI